MYIDVAPRAARAHLSRAGSRLLALGSRLCSKYYAIIIFEILFEAIWCWCAVERVESREQTCIVHYWNFLENGVCSLLTATLEL